MSGIRAVLVHGILDTGQVFRGLAAYLTARGVECLTPSLSPNDGRYGLRHLAEQLKRRIDAAFGPDTPIVLVGFSMGGLISRCYLQDLGGYRRTRRFFAISVPFAGTLWSELGLGGRGVKEMRPGSDFLAGLERGVDRLKGMEIVSYWTPFDLVIVPPTSSVWPRAHNVRILAPCHPCMLWSAGLKRDLSTRLGLP